MKRILFVGLIALMVLLAVPAAMATDTAGVKVTGDLEKSIDVAVSPATTIPLLEGFNYDNSATLTVIPSGVSGNWNVAAADVTSTVLFGHMDNGAVALTLPFQMSADAGASFWPLPIASYFSGSGLGTFTKTVYVGQTVVPADLDGTYDIEVTFTASVV